MKKSLIALAVFGSFASVASAQSSVTLFGVVDANLRYTKAGGETLKTLGTDGLASSRLGFRGVEDLGGGLKASFWLEHRLQPDAGGLSSSRFWHGRSSVSLSGEFGEVRLGRFLTNHFTAYADYDPFNTNGVGDVNKMHLTMGGASGNQVRADNIVGYFLPSMGGVYGSVEVAAGEGVDNANKYLGARIGYKAGPMDFSGAYTTSDGGVKADTKRFTLGASYDLGMAKLMGAYTQNKFGSAKQTVLNIGAHVPMGSGQFRVSFVNASANTAAEATIGDSKMIALGYVHNLSKRTGLYGTIARVTNDGKGKIAVAGSPAVAAGGDSGGFEVGVRHSF